MSRQEAFDTLFESDDWKDRKALSQRLDTPSLGIVVPRFFEEYMSFLFAYMLPLITLAWHTKTISATEFAQLFCKMRNMDTDKLYPIICFLVNQVDDLDQTYTDYEKYLNDAGIDTAMHSLFVNARKSYFTEDDFEWSGSKRKREDDNESDGEFSPSYSPTSPNASPSYGPTSPSD
jgi:hypothetical protein